jgi:hypothetical protein
MRRPLMLALAGALALGVASGASPAYANSVPDIGLWSTNTTGVECVQYALDEYDHELSNNPNWRNWVAVDGSYGPQTRQAVIWFQESMNKINNAGLAVDGIVGQHTGGWIDQFAWSASKDWAPSWVAFCDQHVPDDGL